MKSLTFFCLLLACCLLAPLYGQGVTINSPITVNQARDLPHNSWVIINGNIINSLPGGQNYTFRDSTGEVTVEIDRRVWRGLSIGPSDVVQIQGELQKERGTVSIKARALITAEAAVTRPGQAIFTYPITISEARSISQDSWIMLIGHILEVQANGRHFTFRDTTGEMLIEIDQSVWRGLFVGASDLVQITGELASGPGGALFIVRVIRGMGT